MASRHDIISITFQANAAKANAPIQALESQAKKSAERVEELKHQLDTLKSGPKTAETSAEIDRMTKSLKQEMLAAKQWKNAHDTLTKGVRTLDDAIKQFNSGTLEQMNAAFSKTAKNAAKLAQSRMSTGSNDWKQMDALIHALDENILKATTDINGLVSNIEKGGNVSKAALSQAKSDLKQLRDLESAGTKEWMAYDKQLKTVTASYDKLVQAEQKAAQADKVDVMNKRMRSLKTLSDEALAETKRFWQQMVAGADDGSAELEKYEANLQKVVNQERNRGGKSAEKVLTNMDKSGIDNVRNAVSEMTQLRDSTMQGIPAWQHYNKLVKQGEEYLAQYAEREKIARGETVSLADAMKLSATAGGKGFQGTAQQLQMAEEAIKKAMLTTEKGSQEWMQYKEALAKLRVETQNTTITSERMREIIGKPINAKNLDELKAAVKRAKAELHLMGETVGNSSKEYDELAAQTKKAEFQLKKMEGAANGTASSFEKAFSRLKTYLAIYIGGGAMINKAMGSVGDIMEMSDKMGEVRKTTGFTDDEVGHLSNTLKKLDTRTAINGLLELSAAAGQLGLKSEADVEGFTEAANKMIVALPEMGKDGATQMLKIALATGEIDKIQQQMAEGTIHGSSAVAVAMEKIGSTIDRLRASSASAAPAITDFVQRVGAVGAQNGIAISQIAALGSTVDSLGMRVEMSATALSRMIPAIRDNAFDIAKVIGVTPDTLRNLFDTGRGMEAILMILQHIKDSGMDADSVESMLGMGSMKEIMKELNQQGARAGIVFSGLSQNVDELRRQLGVADEAYEQNIAIQQEYDKMNETTAAKWERLKNQISEVFVSDTSQRFLGGLIDALRGLVDFLTGNVSPALRVLSDVVKTVAIGFVVFKLGLGEALFVKSISGIKSMIDSFRLMGMYMADQIKTTWALIFAKNADEAASIRAAAANRGLSASMMANIWLAVAAAILYACYKLYQWNEAAKEGSREAARFEAELQKEQDKVDKLAYSIAEARVKIEDANKEVVKATATLNAAKKAADGSAESNRRLTIANAALIEAEEKKRRLMAAHKQLIEQFNKDYSKYLGFMLSEVSSNELLAKSRELVNQKLRETITLKRREASLERIEKENGPDRDEAYADLHDFVTNAITKDPGKQAALMIGVSKIAKTSKSVDEFKKKVEKLYSDPKKKLDPWFKHTFSFNALNYFLEVAKIREKDKLVYQRSAAELSVDRHDSQSKLYGVINAAMRDYRRLTAVYYKSKGKKKAQAAANLLKAGDTLNDLKDNAASYFNLSNPGEAAAYKKNITNILVPFTNRRNKFRGKLLKDAGNLYQSRQKLVPFSGSGSNGRFKFSNTNYTPRINTSPWGDKPEATSTDYASWNVEELVNRRNQMDKFKNVLKPGVDIKKVLAEDKALMKAFGDKKISWQEALNWYNAERKKIQEELNSKRFSTNQGHWRDETKIVKKGKKKVKIKVHRNIFQESDKAIAELNSYYSRRKKALEDARAAENISEETYNRETEKLEQEHLERRSKLRGSFTGEISEKEIAAFRKWWADLVKQFELDDANWGTIKNEWAKAKAADIGENKSKMTKDLEDMSLIVMKHINQIGKIIEKERPFNGITDNLKANLTTMDILFADKGSMTEEEVKSGSREVEGNRRMTFLLGEASKVYNLTGDELMEDMHRSGLGSWADAINSKPDAEELKRRMLAQLRITYDALQEAIKKESAVIKKQVDIWWADLAPGQNDSNKDVFENALAAFGLEEEQIKRANQLISAGYASEKVADELAIKQMKIRLQMQQTYYAKMREIGIQRKNMLQEEANQLKKQANEEKAKGHKEDAEKLMNQWRQKQLDVDNIGISLNLAEKEESRTVAEKQKELQLKTEEEMAKLYKELKEWSNMFGSSIQGIFEASHTGDKQYYNDLAKLNLTGKGGPGAGTYIVTEHEGTSDATAHYEYLDEREALERQRKIENDNALADAWKKLFDNFNTKLSETITDQINALLQRDAIDANTSAMLANTDAICRQTAVESAKTQEVKSNEPKRIVEFGNMDGVFEDTNKEVTIPLGGEQATDSTQPNVTTNANPLAPALPDPIATLQPYIDAEGLLTDTIVQNEEVRAQAKIDTNTAVTDTEIANNDRLNENKVTGSNDTTAVLKGNTNVVVGVQKKGDKDTANSSRKTFAAMTAAANMYGIAYQAMSNDNLSFTQKVQMMMLQAAGQALISMLTASMAASAGDTAVNAPRWMSKLMGDLGHPGGEIAIAAFTAVLGGLMGLATSKISKSKSTIAQVTGASASAGRLATGMLTYATGNVNEFTDPASLTPGSQYNVDAADGRTYRARYMGSSPRTHITNGPEFHLAGERGREMIIDAGTTRQITMNENEIWRTIQTLSNGGRINHTVGKRMGIPTFADGNVSDFTSVMDGVSSMSGMSISPEQAVALQSSIDRQSDLLERALTEGIKGVFNVHGPDGLVANYDRGKKTANLHGEPY